MIVDGGIDVYTKFHVSQSISCGDISLKTTNINLNEGLEETSGDHQSQ